MKKVLKKKLDGYLTKFFNTSAKFIDSLSELNILKDNDPFDFLPKTNFIQFNTI